MNRRTSELEGRTLEIFWLVQERTRKRMKGKRRKKRKEAEG